MKVSRNLFILSFLFASILCYSKNYGEFSENSYIFYDAEKDTQSKTSYSSDLTEFKLTSSSSGLNFELKFATLPVLNNRILPLIQIGIDWSDTGVALFYDQNAVNNPSQNPYSKIKFDKLIYAYDTDTTILKEQNTVGICSPNDRNDGWELSFPANQGTIFEHNLSSKTVKIFTPFLAIGGEDKYKDKWVKFSVAIFISSAAVTGNESDAVYNIISDKPDKPNISDVVSIFDTDEELKDNEISFYFSIKFDSTGNITKSSFSLTNKNINLEGVYDGKIILESQIKPKIVFNYSSDDPKNIPLVYLIEISEDNFLTSEQLKDFFDENLINKENATAKAELNYSLKGNTTYYIRAKVLDSQGIWSSTTTSQSFFTQTSSVTFETQKAWIKVVYNNPFKKGDKTILAYYIDNFDQKVWIRVYSITGEFIKTLVDGELKREKAIYQIEWNGKDEEGNFVSSGIYLILLEVGEDKSERDIAKVVFVK